MALQVITGIDRKRRIIDWGAIRNHHEDSALFAARQQPLVDPVERLAVDILLEKSLTHHQPEIFARAPPRRISGLVDDMAKIVQAARIGRFAGGEPSLARLSALPGARGEAQDLNLHTAALERAGQNIGTGCCHRDRTSPH